MDKMTQQNLKTEYDKNNKPKMKKRLLNSTLTIFSLLLFSLFFFNIVSANQFFEYEKFLKDNRTLEKFASITYQPSDYDTIKAGNPYQFYVWYHGNLADWNEVNLNNSVDYCSLKIQISKGVSLLNRSLTTNTNSTPYTIFQENFTENIQDGKYFVNLFPQDSAYIYLDCYYENPQERPNRFIMPMDYSVVAPTYECKACQYFEWATDQVTLNKAKTLGGYTTDNLTYMLRFFNMFYEILVIGFWILLILLVILAMGILFFGIYWIFKLMYKYMKF